MKLEGEPPRSDRTTEFLRLLGPHERGLMAFVLALVPSWADADDILQEVRTRLWDQFDQFDRSKDFGAWARAIAHFQVLTWRKSVQRQGARFDAALIDLLAAQIENRAGEGDERLAALRTCLEKLNPQHRAQIDQYYSGAKSARQLAEEAGRTFHAVRHTLQRTRVALAECIAKALAEGSRP